VGTVTALLANDGREGIQPLAGFLGIFVVRGGAEKLLRLGRHGRSPDESASGGRTWLFGGFNKQYAQALRPASARSVSQAPSTPKWCEIISQYEIVSPITGPG
jgi:hypothetical protein